MKKNYSSFQKANIVFLFALLLASPGFTQQFTKLTNILPTIAQQVLTSTWVDYDEDGDLDLFVSGGVSPNNLQGYHYLFQNNCNGDFTRITALPDGVANDRGKTWLDIDNDGDIDLYIPQSAVYYNNGDGTFLKNTTINIIAFGEKTRGHSFADIDNDGDLDLFLANDARNLGPQNDILYFQNNGNGTYTQVTTGDVVNDGLLSETGIWGDYDNDGDMDLFVTIIASGTFIGFHHLLYTNDGTGNFTKVITGPIPIDLCSASGANWIDYDNDMDLDLFVYNVFGIPIRLYQNDGAGNLVNMATAAGISIHPLGNDHAWGDYDNDGDLDLYISSINSQNILYINNGNGTLTLNNSEVISNDILVESYGAQWTDYDNDGDLDLFVANAFGAPASFFYQNNGNANHWIDIKLTGSTSNISAIGARIFLKATIGGTPIWQMHEVNANISSSSAGPNLLNQHFGLRDATIIDSIKIVWPASGNIEIFTNVTPDRFIKITEGVSAITEASPCKPDLLPNNAGLVTGQVYSDADSNCIFNSSNDFPVVNRIIEATPGPNFVYSNNNGNYEFRLNAGTYNITQATISNDIWGLQSCQPSGTYTVSVTNNNTFSGNDFPLQPVPPTPICSATVDIFSVPNIFPGNCNPPTTLSSPCPGFNWRYCVTVTNSLPGNTIVGTNSQLQVVLDPNMVFVSMFSDPCGLGNPVITGCTPQCTLTWVDPNPPPPNNFPNLTPGEACTVCFNVNVPGLGPVNSSSANFTAICGTQTNMSSDVEMYSTNCSCDPNDKLVAPEGCGQMGNISKNQPLTYTIRFQNTGTGPAHNIVLRDVIDNDLDVTTFQILESSHNITHVQIIPDNALIVSFEGIELPDSGSNPQGSHGFVTFTINPKPGLSDGTTITNQAGIYFDFNSVVLTNSTLNTLLDNPEPIADFDSKHSCTNTGLIYDFSYAGGTADNATFSWNFGTDATPSVSTAENPTGIVYSSTGTKPVTLIVTRFGCTATITKNIEVISVIAGINNNQVVICHNGHTISISENALQTHLNHGDCIGLCVHSSKISELYSISDDGLTFEAFPNPFINKTEIIYSVPENCNIKIRVYNYLGDIVTELFNGEVQDSGPSKLYFESSGLSSGIYYVALESSVGYKLIKLVVIK